MPDDDSPRQRLPGGVITLGWVSFLTDVASDMIYPLLPDFLTRVLGASPAALGLIEGVAESTASFAKLFSGWWSDRLRRRKPLVLFGYVLAGAVRPLVGLATTWSQVLAIRFTDRMGKGVRTAPRDALIAGLVPPRDRGRAFGLQRAMDNAGAFAGPLLAALLLRFVFPDERNVFLLAFLPGLAAIVLLAWKVRERRQVGLAAAPAMTATPAPPGRLPGRLKAAIGIFVLFTLANSTDAFLLLRARECGIALWQIPLLWAFFHAVKAASGVPGGALSDRIGRIPALFLGWLVYAASYVGFAYAGSPAAAWALFAFYGLFFGLTEGAERALVAGLAPDRLRGRAFGAFHGAVGFAALPASLLFGWWWSAFGPRTAFLIGAALAGVAAAALLLFRLSQGPLAAEEA